MNEKTKQTLEEWLMERESLDLISTVFVVCIADNDTLLYVYANRERARHEANLHEENYGESCRVFEMILHH